MESTSNTLAGSASPATDNEHRNSTDRSNDSAIDLLSAANASTEPVTEGQILAGTLNQLLHAAPRPGGVNPTGNPTPLTHSNLNLLATLASASPAAGLATKPRDRSGTESIDTKSGSLVGDDGIQGNIVEEIGPPTVLPDLNMAMAEGLAAVGGAEQQTDKKQGHVTGSVDPVATASNSTASASLSRPVKAAQRSGETLGAKSKAPSALSLHQKCGDLKTLQMHPNSADDSILVNSISSSSSLVPRVSSQSASSSAAHTPKQPLVVPASQTATSGRATPLQFPPPSAVTPITHPSSSSVSTSLPASQLVGLSAAATSQAISTSSASMLAKGLNLPLLQFLNLNFPSLKIKDLQDVLSINSLLTQVLKQQINNPSSSSASLTTQQLTEASKLGQPTLKTVIPSSKSPTKVPSNTASAKVARSQVQVPSKLVAVSPTVSGATPSPSLPLPVSVPSAASSSKTLSSLTPTTAAQFKPQQLTADGKLVDLTTQLTATGLGVNMDLLSKRSSSLLSTLSSPSTSTAMAASGNNRKAVLVQILNKTGSSSPTTVTTTPPSKDPILIPRMVKPLSKSPLILNRNRCSQLQQHKGLSASPSATINTTSTTSYRSSTHTSKPSTPVSSLCVSLSLPALKGSLQLKDPVEKKRKTPSRKSAHQVTPSATSDANQLNRTVVQPAESEAMEVDVGQPVQKMKLPKHLRDHSYSLFNPDEAEKQRILSATNFSFISTIPPARLSYAPLVPDSPSTLHKLLKVLPKKNSRQTHSPPRARKGFGRGGRGGRKMGKSRVGKGSTKKATPTLTTVSDPSSSDQSDSDETSRKVKIQLI